MSTSTPNFGLTTDLVAKDYAQPDHINKLADVLDRIAFYLKYAMYGGVYSGWGLNTSGEVESGEGLVGGCWCKTAANTDISSQLIAGNTNYVYATANSTSPDDGTVTFTASLSVTVPDGSIRLGSMVVSGGSVVTTVNNNDPAYRRDYIVRFRLNQLTDTWSGTVALGASSDLTVDHSDERTFNIGICPTFTGVSANIRIEMLFEGYTTSTFKIRIYNDNAYGGSSDVAFTWTRWGL